MQQPARRPRAASAPGGRSAQIGAAVFRLPRQRRAVTKSGRGAPLGGVDDVVGGGVVAGASRRPPPCAPRRRRRALGCCGLASVNAAQ